MGFGVWGLEFGVWGLGFGVWGLGSLTTTALHCSFGGVRVEGRIRVHGLGVEGFMRVSPDICRFGSSLTPPSG